MIGAPLLALLLASAPAAQAGDDPTLRILEQEVQRLRGELDRFDSRQTGILASLERLSLERLWAEEELKRLRLERRRTEGAIAAARARSEELARRIEGQKAALAAALRQAYKMGRLRDVRLVLAVRDPADLGRAVRYLADWSRADAERVERFRADAAALEGERASLDARLADLARLGRDASARESDLERNRGEQQAALRRLQDEREAAEESLKEVEEAAGRLQALLESLPPGERLPVDGRLVDLETLKGHLPWPVPGPVEVPFGEVRHPRFRTVTPHPGVDLQAAEGTPVRPILGGRVAFSDWFRGYGNTVIVDHGGGLVSVYAHLRSLDVAVGDAVDPGAALGLSGSTGSLQGPRLYLEIRRQGRPVDPLGWLRPPSAAP